MRDILWSVIAEPLTKASHAFLRCCSSLATESCCRSVERTASAVRLSMLQVTSRRSVHPMRTMVPCWLIPNSSKKSKRVLEETRFVSSAQLSAWSGLAGEWPYCELRGREAQAQRYIPADNAPAAKTYLLTTHR